MYESHPSPPTSFRRRHVGPAPRSAQLGIGRHRINREVVAQSTDQRFTTANRPRVENVRSDHVGRRAVNGAKGLGAKAPHDSRAGGAVDPRGSRIRVQEGDEAPEPPLLDLVLWRRRAPETSEGPWPRGPLRACSRRLLTELRETLHRRSARSRARAAEAAAAGRPRRRGRSGAARGRASRRRA